MEEVAEIKMTLQFKRKSLGASDNLCTESVLQRALERAVGGVLVDYGCKLHEYELVFADAIAVINKPTKITARMNNNKTL